jgi:hypothetical protein
MMMIDERGSDSHLSKIVMDGRIACGASHGPDGSCVWFEDKHGNRIELAVASHLADRLHECWAATAPTPIAPTTPRR